MPQRGCGSGLPIATASRGRNRTPVSHTDRTVEGCEVRGTVRCDRGTVGQQCAGVSEDHDTIAQQAPVLLGVAHNGVGRLAVRSQRTWARGLMRAHNATFPNCELVQRRYRLHSLRFAGLPATYVKARNLGPVHMPILKCTCDVTETVVSRLTSTRIRLIVNRPWQNESFYVSCYKPDTVQVQCFL
jgi:hypothetical protein